MKFVKIQWTLQSKKEGKGDNAVSFFFFFFRPDRTPSVGYIYTALTMIYFYTRHTSSSKIGTAQIDEQHTATFSANMLLCYAVVDFTCFRKSFESTCSKQVPPPSGVLSLSEDFQKYGWMPLSKAFLQQYFPYNLTKHS